MRPILRDIEEAGRNLNHERLYDLLLEFHAVPADALSYDRGGTGRRQLRRRNNGLQANMTNMINRRPTTTTTTPTPHTTPDSQTTTPTATPRPEASTTDPVLSRRAHRCTALARHNHLSRAVSSLYSGGLAPPDEATAAALRLLHPTSSSSIPPLPTDSPYRPVLPDSTFVKIWKKRIATGAAPAASGFTGDHGLPLLEDPDCLRGLAYLIELIRNGCLNERCRDLLLSCPLVAVPKPAGGVRPIAIGETLYKMAASYAMHEVLGDAIDILGDDQFALQSGGSEVASLLLKALAEQHSLAATDLQNAFNALDRGHMLRVLFSHRRLAPIFRLVYWSYSSPVSLNIFNRNGSLLDTILSICGTRQGDPLSSLLFSLCISPAIEAAKRAALNATGEQVDVVAISDDVTFSGAPDGIALQVALLTFSEEVALMGLSWVGRKSYFAAFHGQPLDPTTTAFAATHGMRVEREACVIGGTPMGRVPERVQALALAIAEKSQNFFTSIRHSSIPASVADRLLRVCGLPRLNHLSRVGLLGEYSNALDFFDAEVSAAAHFLTRPDPSLPPLLDQLQPPLRFGGLAFRNYQSHVAPYAHWSCIAQAAPHLNRLLPAGLPPAFSTSITNTLALITPQLPPDITTVHLPPPTATPPQVLAFYGNSPALAIKLQRTLTRAAEAATHQATLIAATPLDRTRILACSAPLASAWLADPFPATPMHDQAHTAAMLLRLNLPISSSLTHYCHCGFDLTTDPWHCLVHKAGNFAILRHNNIIDVLADFVGKAGGRSWVEPRQQHWHDDRRGDLRVVLGAQTFLLDAGVVHPTSPSYLRHATLRALGAAENYASIKTTRYREMARQEESTFVPFILETYGGFCKAARDFMSTLSSYGDLHSATWKSRELHLGLRSAIQTALFEGNLRIMHEELQVSAPVPRGFGRAALPDPCPGGTAGRNTRQRRHLLSTLTTRPPTTTVPTTTTTTNSNSLSTPTTASDEAFLTRAPPLSTPVIHSSLLPTLRPPSVTTPTTATHTNNTAITTTATANITANTTITTTAITTTTTTTNTTNALPDPYPGGTVGRNICHRRHLLNSLTTQPPTTSTTATPTNNTATTTTATANTTTITTTTTTTTTTTLTITTTLTHSHPNRHALDFLHRAFPPTHPIHQHLLTTTPTTTTTATNSNPLSTPATTSDEAFLPRSLPLPTPPPNSSLLPNPSCPPTAMTTTSNTTTHTTTISTATTTSNSNLPTPSTPHDEVPTCPLPPPLSTATTTATTTTTTTTSTTTLSSSLSLPVCPSLSLSRLARHCPQQIRPCVRTPGRSSEVAGTPSVSLHLSGAGPARTYRPTESD